MAGILEFLSAGLFRDNVNVAEDQIRWQNGLVGKMHAATATVLALFTFGVFTKELIGDHIRCIRYSEESQVSEAAFNSYCYITDTFSLPGAQGPHPGVGPHRADLEPVHHSYYQWVPYLLFIQAASFYLPYMLNKFSHDNRITSLIQNLQNVIPFNENRMDKIGDIHLYTQDFFGSHRYWATKLVLSDFLNLINIGLNIAGVNWYLRGQFVSYGPKFLMHQLADGENPFTTIFPKMTKCTLELFGPSGSIINHDGLCVLPINVLNERIYIILWFIFIPLFFITIVEQIIWLFFMINKKYRNRYLMRWLLPDMKLKHMSHEDGTPTIISHDDARRQLRRTLRTLGFGDWLLLYMIARNIDRVLFTTLATNVYPPGSGYYPDEPKDEDPDQSPDRERLAK